MNTILTATQVILGFSITAYLTVALLIFHYITVYNPQRVGSGGQEYENPVDRGILEFVRQRIIAWSPRRRFEYAMEKSVLILSDTQLVTGLAILISGYSQLSCGITAYHWQIIVFVAWFSSFTFLSAMAFLEGYFQTNHSLRIIRVCFMFILGGLQIVALLPTGSQNWLDLYGEGGGFYPSLSAQCYFEQLTMASFTSGGPRIWSMILSVLVVGISYIHSGVRLFDSTAAFSRRYFRTVPGTYLKGLLYFLERKADQRALGAAIWTLPYLLSFFAFSSARAFYDLAESMLLEIIWLSFAIAWGTIKVWATRASAQYTYDGNHYGYSITALGEDSWSFGQTLPLVLLLLPILSMAQSYLDNDAKAHDAPQNAAIPKERPSPEHAQPAGLSTVLIAEREEPEMPDTRNSTSCSITRCNHHQPSVALSRYVTRTLNEEEASSISAQADNAPPVPPRSPSRPYSSSPRSVWSVLPRHPYRSFTCYSWYKDHIALLVFQTLMLGSVILFVQNLLSSFLGISSILRNRLFLVWIFAMIPLASFVHLALWYLAAWLVCQWGGAEDWLKGEGRFKYHGEEKSWWKSITMGRYVYWGLRLVLLGGCLAFTFFLSVEIAGPAEIEFTG